LALVAKALFAFFCATHAIFDVVVADEVRILSRGSFVQPLLDKLGDAPINFVALIWRETQFSENDVIQSSAVGHMIELLPPRQGFQFEVEFMINSHYYDYGNLDQHEINIK
jgi:hypothetical protein